MELKPLADRIVVLRAPKAKNAAGLYIPDVATEQSDKGRVLSVGPDVKTVKRGHMVLFAKYSGQEVKADGIPMLIMTEKSIIAVLLDEEHVGTDLDPRVPK